MVFFLGLDFSPRLFIAIDSDSSYQGAAESIYWWKIGMTSFLNNGGRLTEAPDNISLGLQSGKGSDVGMTFKVDWARRTNYYMPITKHCL